MYTECWITKVFIFCRSQSHPSRRRRGGGGFNKNSNGSLSKTWNSANWTKAQAKAHTELVKFIFAMNNYLGVLRFMAMFNLSRRDSWFGSFFHSFSFVCLPIVFDLIFHFDKWETNVLCKYRIFVRRNASNNIKLNDWKDERQNTSEFMKEREWKNTTTKTMSPWA